MKRFVLPAAAACLVLGVAAVAIGSGVLSRPGQSPYKAVVQSSATTVSAREGASGPYAVVDSDKVVAPGDGIRTNETGTAVLTHFDGSTVALGPLTEIVVEDLNGTDQRALSLTLGRIAVSITKLTAPGSRYEIRTPSATIAVRGTRFAVTVAADGRTEVEVSEGRVALSASGESIELGGGESGVVERPGARPIKKGVATAPISPVPAVTPPQAATGCTSSSGTNGPIFICVFIGLPPGAVVEVTRQDGTSPARIVQPAPGGFTVAPDGSFRIGFGNGAGSVSTITATAGGVSRTAQFEGAAPAVGSAAPVTCSPFTPVLTVLREADATWIFRLRVTEDDALTRPTFTLTFPGGNTTPAAPFGDHGRNVQGSGPNCLHEMSAGFGGSGSPQSGRYTVRAVVRGVTYEAFFTYP